MASGIVRPNNNFLVQWELWGGSGDHFERVGENITQPTPGDDGGVKADDDDDGDTEEFHMTSIGGVQTVTAVTAWTFGSSYSVQPTIDIFLGAYLGAKTCTWSPVANWSSYTWSGLSKTQANLDLIRVKFVSPTHDKTSTNVLGCVYIIVYYTVPPTGYTHAFCGVLPANIGNISGVPTVNIGKVKGV